MFRSNCKSTVLTLFFWFRNYWTSTEVVVCQSTLLFTVKTLATQNPIAPTITRCGVPHSLRLAATQAVAQLHSYVPCQENDQKKASYRYVRDPSTPYSAARKFVEPKLPQVAATFQGTLSVLTTPLALLGHPAVTLVSATAPHHNRLSAKAACLMY